MTKSLMGIPRSDKLPPSTRTTRKFRKSDAESYEMKTEISGDRKECPSYLHVIKKEWQDVFLNLFVFFTEF